MKSDYGTSLLNSTEEYNLDTAEVNLVRSFGVHFSKDGDMFCCLLGKDLQSGYATFDKSPINAIRKMRAYLYSGIERRND